MTAAGASDEAPSLTNQLPLAAPSASLDPYAVLAPGHSAAPAPASTRPSRVRSPDCPPPSGPQATPTQW